MMSIMLFLLSIGLQIAAAIFSLLLVRTTGRKLAWILLSLAMVLMAWRRIVSFVALLAGGKTVVFSFPEYIALIISGLMLIGVLRIGVYFGAMQTEEAKRRLAEDELRLHEARLQNLLILQKMEQSTEQEIFDFTLDASLLSGQSEFAFIGKMSEDEAEMIVQSWSKHTLDQCAVAESPIHCRAADLGLLGAVVKQRRPIVVNDYEASAEFKKGCPAGHVAIKRFLCVPVFRSDRMVAVAAVANKASEYNEPDISAFTSLLNEMWNLIERRQAEQIIRASEERFRRITETVSDYIYSVRSEDGAPIETRHSDACVAVTGYTREEFAADPYLWIEMVVGEDSDLVVQQAKDVIAGKDPVAVEHRIIRKDGAIRWVENSLVPTMDKDGNLVSYDGIIRDITERKKAEHALRDSEIQLRAVLDSINAGIVIIDPETHTVVDVNSLALKLFGRSKNEVVGSSCHGYICSSEEGTCPITDLHQTLDLSERKLLNAKGETIPILKSVVLVKLGEYPLLIESFIDISERNRTENLMRGILESIDQGFIVVDRDYRLITANRAFAEEFNMPIEDVVGKHCYDVSRHSDRPCHEKGERCAVKEVFEKGEPCEILHTHVKANSDLMFYKKKAYPLSKDKDGNIVTVIETIFNVTQEKYLENQLRHAQKMEAVGQLAGGVAHDFNNILSAIIGYGHIALMKMATDDTQRQNIEHMLEAADRAAHLTKDLLLFSRKQVSDLKPVDLNEIIRKVEKFLIRVIGEDVICKTILHSPASPVGASVTSGSLAESQTEKGMMVLADEHQLEQVLMNLATNARDAMPMGGEFLITTETVRLDAQFVLAHKYGKPGMHALITVSDSGTGMDETTRKRIFDPFFTTKEVGKGTGLGLSVVYGIVKQHDGYVNVYSEKDKGTTFRIYLPLIGSGKKKETIAPDEETPARGVETVLLAEDDESVRKLSTTILTQSGYTVIEAVNGEDAVNKFIENKDRIHLLLFDLIMPKMNGKEAYNKIKKIRPDMQVIFSTGYAPEIIRQKASLKDGTHLIYKPVSPLELLRTVRNVLDGTSEEERS